MTLKGPPLRLGVVRWLPHATQQEDARPLVDYLRLGARPYLRANECTNCGARFFDRRNACASCGKTEFKNARVKNGAKVKAFTIVHRAAPGIPAPYVSAIVDLEGGGTVKGNLINVDPDPQKISMGMPIEVIYKKAPAKDAEGNEYLTYYFQPRS